MPAIEVGRICVKNRGREAGKKCVVVDLADKSFVLVTGPKSVTGVKRRRVNTNHLQALPEKLEVNRDASDEEIAELLKSEGKLDFMTEQAQIIT